jgi:hypothetical protein
MGGTSWACPITTKKRRAIRYAYDLIFIIEKGEIVIF